MFKTSWNSWCAWSFVQYNINLSSVFVIDISELEFVLVTRALCRYQIVHVVNKNRISGRGLIFVNGITHYSVLLKEGIRDFLTRNSLTTVRTHLLNTSAH